ncbi:MAG: hypothetical protein Q7R88_03270 [bacterium]|nr:hypothetical protein [bacterium]
MLHFIEQLQKKPEPVRKKIALFAACGITLLVVLFWLLSLTAGTPDSAVTVSKSDSSVMEGEVSAVREAFNAIKERMTGVESIYPILREENAVENGVTGE